jgi:hypothetical protein
MSKDCNEGLACLYFGWSIRTLSKVRNFQNKLECGTDTIDLVEALNTALDSMAKKYPAWKRALAFEKELNQDGYLLNFTEAE